MSSGSNTRSRLFTELDRAMRMMTAQSVLLSQSIAALAGLNSTDLECLDVIQTKGVATAGDLAAATGLTTGAITSVIDRLEQAHYLRRESEPADRRKVLLRLRPHATQKIEALYAPLQRELLSLWSRYDDEGIAFVIGFIEKTGLAVGRQVAALQSKARMKSRRPS